MNTQTESKSNKKGYTDYRITLQDGTVLRAESWGELLFKERVWEELGVKV